MAISPCGVFVTNIHSSTSHKKQQTCFNVRLAFADALSLEDIEMNTQQIINSLGVQAL